MALDIVENLYRANDTFVAKEDAAAKETRLKYQRNAMTELKLIGYFSMLACERLFSEM